MLNFGKIGKYCLGSVTEFQKVTPEDKYTTNATMPEELFCQIQGLLNVLFYHWQ